MTVTLKVFSFQDRQMQKRAYSKILSTASVPLDLNESKKRRDQKYPRTSSLEVCKHLTGFKICKWWALEVFTLVIFICFKRDYMPDIFKKCRLSWYNCISCGFNFSFLIYVYVSKSFYRGRVRSGNLSLAGPTEKQSISSTFLSVWLHPVFRVLL